MLHVTPEDLHAIFEEAAHLGTPVRWRIRAEYGETIAYASGSGERNKLAGLSPEARRRYLHGKRKEQYRRATAEIWAKRPPRPTHGVCARCYREVERVGNKFVKHVRPDGAACVWRATTSRDTFVVPEGVTQEICPKCGGVREWRPGLRKPIHLGGACRQKLEEKTG